MTRDEVDLAISVDTEEDSGGPGAGCTTVRNVARFPQFHMLVRALGGSLTCTSYPTQ